MAIPFYDEVNTVKRVNIVNSDDSKLKDMGLKPLIMNLKPLFFDSDGNICYLTNTDHYETIIQNHVKDAFSIIHDDYDNSKISREAIYAVYKNKLYFLDLSSYRYFLYSKRFKEEIEKKAGCKLEIYIPTKDEILDSYYEKFIDFSSRDIKFIGVLPTKEDELMNYYYFNIKNDKIKCSFDITGTDVLRSLNYNANVFDIIPFYSKGIYNNNAKDIMNQYYKIKEDIYSKIFSLGIESKNVDEMIKRLIKVLHLYRDKKYIGKKEELSKIYKDLSNDFLVMFLGYSKIETVRNKTITTAKQNIYEEFFNYILMGYDIVKVPRLIYDKDKNDFIIKEISNLTTEIDREMEEEIKQIKKYVPYDELHRFFR